MEQVTFADVEYEGKKRRTRRELFLERMEALVPWERLEERIRPFYPKAGRGRQPYPLAAMLRIHCVQLCYNLSDPGMEDMLYEIESVRRFAGLRLAGPLPDETTILNFRHLLERHGLGRGLFEEINAYLAERGYRVRAGTIVDASIIAAPSSTKNREGVRDPEMHQTKKGNEWHFGMKAHIGVDAETGLVHGVRTTPANTHDLREAGALLHGGEEEVWADAGLPGDREAGGHGRPSGAVACGDETGAAEAPGAGRSAVGARAGQGLGAGQGGAPVPVCEAALRLPEGSLPRAGQEHRTDRAAPGLREPARGGPLFDGVRSRRGNIRPRRAQRRDHRPEHAGLARFQPVIAPKTPETGSLRPAPPPERPCSELP